MQVAVHVWIWECSEVLSLVFLLARELLIPLEWACLGLLRSKMLLVHLSLDSTQVVVSLARLLLIFAL